MMSTSNMTASSISRRDRMTNRDVYVPKSQSETPLPLFAMTPDRSCVVSDDPNDLATEYQSQVVGTKYNNQLPFEQVRDQPITEREMRQLVSSAPKTLEELYPEGQARQVYDTCSLAPPATAMGRPSLAPEVARNRVPRTFETDTVGGASGTRSLQTGAGAAPLHGDVDSVMRFQNRSATEDSAFGFLGPALSKHTRGNEEERASVALGAAGHAPMNDLSVCGGGRLGVASGISASGLVGVVADSAEPPRDTKKEWLVLHPREYGEFQSTATLPEKLRVRSDDLPRTTVRETLIHDTHEGTPTAPGPGRSGERPVDAARKTVRETMPVGYQPRNMNGRRREVMVVDLKSLRAVLGTTHRETLADGKAYFGAGQGKLTGAYGKVQDTIMVPTEPTARDASHVFRLMSAVSQTAKDSLKSLASWLINPLRSDQSERKRWVQPQGARMTPGVESSGDVRLNGKIYRNGRVFGNGKGSEAPSSCPEVVQVSQNKLEVEDNRLSIGAAGAASQFRANPYAAPPLHALARAC